MKNSNVNFTFDFNGLDLDVCAMVIPGQKQINPSLSDPGAPAEPATIEAIGVTCGDMEFDPSGIYRRVDVTHLYRIGTDGVIVQKLTGLRPSQPDDFFAHWDKNDKGERRITERRCLETEIEKAVLEHFNDNQ